MHVELYCLYCCVDIFPNLCTCKSTSLFQLPNRCTCNHSPDDGHFGESQYFYYYEQCYSEPPYKGPFPHV